MRTFLEIVVPYVVLFAASGLILWAVAVGGV